MTERSTSQTELIKAEIRMGAETIRFSAEISNEPVHVHDLLPLFQNITNKVVEIGVKEVEAQGKRISCRSGCGACCSQLVPISRAEGVALLGHIDAMPTDRQQTLRERFSRNMDALQAGLLNELEQAVAGNDRMRLREVGLAYFNLKLACPFLENQSCSIHPVRPLSCREFLVVSDPAYCAKPDPDTVKSVVLPKRVSPIVYEMCGESDQVGRGFLPLTQLLEKVDELQAEQPAESAVELVKRFLQSLGG